MIWLWFILLHVLSFAEDWHWISGTDVTIVDDEGHRAVLEDEGVLVVMESEHYKIHEGNHFTGYANEEDVDAADTMFVYMVTPATGEMQVKFEVGCLLPGVVELYENPSAVDTSLMTAVTFYNNNRQSANTPALIGGHSDSDGIVIFTPPSTGTRLWGELVGSGTLVGSRVGSSSSQNSEWILDTSEEYVLVFISSADNNDVHIVIEYYED